MYSLLWLTTFIFCTDKLTLTINYVRKGYFSKAKSTICFLISLLPCHEWRPKVISSTTGLVFKSLTLINCKRKKRQIVEKLFGSHVLCRMLSLITSKITIVFQERGWFSLSTCPDTELVGKDFHLKARKKNPKRNRLLTLCKGFTSGSFETWFEKTPVQSNSTEISSKVSKDYRLTSNTAWKGKV